MLFSQVRQYIKGLLSRTFSNKSVLDKLSESDNKLTYNGNIIFPNSSAQAGFTPVGTVISVMGVSAPTNYLACNGQIVNITDYPELANYFEQQFGSKNKFGGDGTTTFAVPDLRGEFLRGTGTNSHTNQGNGANVGTHQDATEIPYTVFTNGSSSGAQISVYTNAENTTFSPSNADKQTVPLTNENRVANRVQSASKIPIEGSSQSYAKLTVRPTNTSVLYCIATKNIYIDARYNYSLEEQEVGTWIDGKPLYEKTFEITLTSRTEDKDIGLSALNVDKISYSRAFVQSSGGAIYPLSLVIQGGLQYSVGYFFNANKTLGIRIGTSLEPNALDKLVLTIQYTKTTDQ